MFFLDVLKQHTFGISNGGGGLGDCKRVIYVCQADGHGDNVELKALLKKNGQDYKYNFKYSILEVCNMNLGTDYILGRENYWKSVLQTREFGLNKN